MAGLYSDWPARRLPYEMDGTLLYYYSNSTTVNQLRPNSDLILQNDEDSDSYAMSTENNGQFSRFALVFPITMNLHAYTVFWGSGLWNGVGSVEVSADSTDGINGSWQTVETSVTRPASLAQWRDSVTPITGGLGIKAIRFRATKSSSTSGSWDIQLLHLYGEPAALPDGLYWWHETLDQRLPIAHLDYAEVVPGQVIVRNARIKNTSSTQTANNITVSALSASGTMANGMDFNVGGAGYLTTPTITSLAPGGFSSVINVRNTIPGAGQAVAKYAARIQAVAGSWT